MSNVYWLSEAQMERLKPFVPKRNGKPRVDNRRVLGSLPKAGWLLANRGYDADWFRDVLKEKEIMACIPGRRRRKKTVRYDKWRNCIEIMFGRLKDWPIVGKTVPRTVF